jgi:hypothetical protein
LRSSAAAKAQSIEIKLKILLLLLRKSWLTPAKAKVGTSYDDGYATEGIPMIERNVWNMDLYAIKKLK